MQRVCILVAEDDPVMREMLVQILEIESYDVHGAENAKMALELLERETYEVAIVDKNIAGIDGLELLREIGTRYPDTSVIITSAHHGIREIAMSQGAFECMEKPFGLDDLMENIRRALSQTGIVREPRLCPKCGRQIQVDWRFCPYDGIEV
jgi:DNA-binding NtrC family response regulator